MKRTLLFFLSIIFATFSWGQIYEPVKWSFESKKTGDNQFELQLTAKIDESWHMYSQHLPNEDGPIATSFTFDKSADYTKIGQVSEPKPITEFDPNFEMDLNFFEHKVTFRQKIKTNKAGVVKIKGGLEFMVCDATKCLPPEWVEFEFVVDNSAEFGDTGQGENNGLSESKEETTQEKEGIAFQEGIFDPVSLVFEGKKTSPDEYELSIIAKVDQGWHIYSQDIPPNGPVPTSFTFEESDDYELVGAVEEIGDLISENDPAFGMELKYYENQVRFTQKVKLQGESATVKGEMVYMVCDQVKCLRPKYIDIGFKISNGQVVPISTDENISQQPNTKESGFSYVVEAIDLKNPVNTCSVQESEDEGGNLWNIFILGFLGGLVALLTPCVFPMIPLTVSFFTKGSENKRKGLFRASLYGFFIFLVYIILSLPFHFLDQIDPNILNNISTNIYLNIFFFVIFIVFAISFFGYFELTLPSKWTTRADSAADVGGLLGIFFMALTLALVSFSCTGPILGSLLAGSLTADGGAMQLTSGMAGFGIALALPFALFAAFPGWLNTLPKSGGWLNTVKVILGFLELALAIKFLSNADLVEHWGLLKIEVFLGLWIVIGIGMAIYIFGKIRFPHDSPVTKLSFSRIGFGVLTAAFVIYLCSGFRYNEKSGTFVSLSLLSGLAPPAGYSWIHPNPCPLNLNCFHDYEKGLAYAKETNKPMILDFTGRACVNCRKMEENVWNQPEIFEKLNNDFVLISLYVDDREELPEIEQESYTTKDGRKKRIRTVGDKWATFQTENFANNSQPWYVLLGPDESLLTNAVGYTPDVQDYESYLNCGLEAMKHMPGLAEGSK